MSRVAKWGRWRVLGGGRRCRKHAATLLGLASSYMGCARRHPECARHYQSWAIADLHQAMWHAGYGKTVLR